MRDIAASPRPTGSARNAAARERCARELRELGYDVRERPFEFSEFPGRLATSLMGGAAAFVAGLAARWGADGGGGGGRRFAPLVLLAFGSIALVVAGYWLARRGVLTIPLLRQRGVNLEATRPGETTIWLCAHLDTKSQQVPTLVRSAGIVLESVGYLLTLSLAVLAAMGARVDFVLWGSAAVVTLTGAMPVVSTMVGSRSPGALDNASGVATVIAAARLLTDERGIGVLLTDAEELGLAGARAWSRELSTSTVLNCDGVDDVGGIQVMYTGRRPQRVLDAVGRASGATGVAHHTSRLVPGVLTDSVAFADAGLACVTFSRGSWRSLARVHTPRDDLAHLNGTGIADTATLIAATARTLGEGDAR